MCSVAIVLACFIILCLDIEYIDLMVLSYSGNVDCSDRAYDVLERFISFQSRVFIINFLVLNMLYLYICSGFDVYNLCFLRRIFEFVLMMIRVFLMSLIASLVGCVYLFFKLT